MRNEGLVLLLQNLTVIMGAIRGEKSKKSKDPGFDMLSADVEACVVGLQVCCVCTKWHSHLLCAVCRL